MQIVSYRVYQRCKTILLPLKTFIIQFMKKNDTWEKNFEDNDKLTLALEASHVGLIGNKGNQIENKIKTNLKIF